MRAIVRAIGVRVICPIEDEVQICTREKSEMTPTPLNSKMISTTARIAVPPAPTSRKHLKPQEPIRHRPFMPASGEIEVAATEK